MVIEGTEYKTLEHYLMHQKALVMGDKRTASLILLVASTPAQAKSLGRRVYGYSEDKWEKERERVMFKGLKAKIDQHPELKEKLLRTGSKVIVELHDPIWGNGLTLEDTLKGAKWKGRNVLGGLWMRLRRDLTP